MTGNINNMIKIVTVLMLFNCCVFKSEPNTVNISINNQNYGWYFVELKQDTSMKDLKSIDINIDSTLQLKEITVGNYQNYAFKVFDNAGNEISANMKLPRFVSRFGKRFFSFYNPTKKELELIKNRDPTDPNFLEINYASDTQLKLMIERKSP